MNENYTLKSETSNLIRISSLLILIETWNKVLLYLGATFVLQFFATIQLPTSASELRKALFAGLTPSSIYSWSIGHILEHEFFYLGHLGWAGSKEKKVDLSFSEQLLRVVFSTFWGQKKLKKKFKKHFSNRIEKLHKIAFIIFFFFFFEKVEKSWKNRLPLKF